MGYYVWTDANSAYTLSNNDFTGELTGSGFNNCRTDRAVSSGKAYWEIEIDNAALYDRIGLVASTTATNTRPGDTADSYGWTQHDGWFITNNSAVGVGETWNTGDILAIAYDATSGKVWFAKNNAWSGDPAAGTGEAFSGVASGLFPAIGGQTTGGIATIVSDPALQTYSPPAGFIAGLGEPDPRVVEIEGNLVLSGFVEIIEREIIPIGIGGNLVLTGRVNVFNQTNYIVGNLVLGGQAELLQAEPISINGNLLLSGGVSMFRINEDIEINGNLVLSGRVYAGLEDCGPIVIPEYNSSRWA